MKKLLSVILAIVMLASCAALSLQAFAEQTNPLDRIDFNFTCDPKEGEKVGSDYTLSLSGTSSVEPSSTMFVKPIIHGAETQTDLSHGGHGSTTADYDIENSYIVITKDDDAVVYPKLTHSIAYAPRRTKGTEQSDPSAALGRGAVYEAGSTYNYYLVTDFASPYYLKSNTLFFKNGHELGRSLVGNGQILYGGTMYRSASRLIQLLDTRYISHDVNTIDITFSCNPENGAPVGSDYEIDIDVTADPAGDREISINPTDPHWTPSPAEFNTYRFNDSLVAIFESETCLYPGYEGYNISYAPARKAQAHGSDPTGALGNRGNYTAGTYESGKTYKYYATFEVGDAFWYKITDDTVFYVNGVEVNRADVIVSGWEYSETTYIKVPVATVTCAHVHDMTYHAAVAATVDAEGNVAYYHCEGCGKNFADEAGTQEIANVVVDKLPNTEPHTDPATEPTTEPAQGDDVCAYCGKVHTGPFAGLTRFFHRIILFFRNIFKR